MDSKAVLGPAHTSTRNLQSHKFPSLVVAVLFATSRKTRTLQGGAAAGKGPSVKFDARLVAIKKHGLQVTVY